MTSGSLVHAAAQALELPGLKEVDRKDANLENDGGWPSDSLPYTPYCPNWCTVCLSCWGYGLKVQCLPNISIGLKNREEAPSSEESQRSFFLGCLSQLTQDFLGQLGRRGLK